LERVIEDIQSSSRRRRGVGEEAQAGALEAVEEREPENLSRGKEEKKKREEKRANRGKPREFGGKELV